MSHSSVVSGRTHSLHIDRSGSGLGFIPRLSRQSLVKHSSASRQVHGAGGIIVVPVEVSLGSPVVNGIDSVGSAIVV